MNNKSNGIRFAAKSKYYTVYAAFKEEMENIGYKWYHKFTKFNKEESERLSCVFVCSNWNGNGEDPMMSFSNASADVKVFNLDSEFEEAVSYAKAEYDRRKAPVERVILNREYVAEVYHDRIVVCGETFYKPEVTALFRAAKNAGLV